MDKSQDQILKEALELVSMIPGLKDSKFPEIMRLMVTKEFVDAEHPAADNHKVIGHVMTDYQKAAFTLYERARVEYNLRVKVAGTTKHELADLKDQFNFYGTIFWESVLQVHPEYEDRSKQLTVVQGFQIAEVPMPVCPGCGKVHPMTPEDMERIMGDFEGSDMSNGFTIIRIG